MYYLKQPLFQLACIALLCFGCGEKGNSHAASSQEPGPQQPAADSIPKAPEETMDTKINYYITAPSGLNLRATEDGKSEVLTKIPYGGQATLLSEGKQASNFKVEGMEGNMSYLAYEGQKGYAFSGFLATLPPPKGEPGDKYQYIRDYVSFLQEEGFKAKLEENGTEESTLKITLPDLGLNGCFMITKKLFYIPGEYALPAPGATITYSTPKNPSRAAQEGPYDYVTQTMTHGSREGLGSVLITYKDDSEVGGRKITIEPEKTGTGMVINLQTWSH